LTENVKIDILINNVGIQFEKIKISEINLEDWHKTFETNVFGPVYLTKFISQMMIDNCIAGSVIFITSIHQFIPVRWSSYSSSKAALGMIIKELAIELSLHSIRVNGIAPGWVEEDEQGNLLPYEHCLLNKTSISPTYIGRTCVYLASDYFSKFTTGTVVTIDGGVSLYNSRVALNMPEY
jgi:NAD(P)-dependent dehydrogenase (short-subunit alcohol dehydrogenase family)